MNSTRRSALSCAPAANRPLPRACCVLGALLLTALCWVGGAARAPRALSQGTPAIALSPEAALVGLLPYALTTADLPPGFAADSPSAVLPLETALKADDPEAALALALADGVVVGINQTILPSSLSAGTLLDYTVQLTTDAAAAGRLVTSPIPALLGTRGLSQEPIDLGLRLGEVVVARRLTAPGAGRSSVSGLLVSWQRDRLVFTVLALQFSFQQGAPPPGDDATKAILQTVDAKAARLPLPALANAVPPPASEQQRLAAYLRLKTLEIPEEEAPTGYEFSDDGLSHPAEFVVGQDDPLAALRRIDGLWQRVIEAYQTFDSTDVKSDAALTAAYALDADAAAAIVDAQDIVLNEGRVLLVIEPPVQLGDFTLAFRTGFDSRGGTVSATASIEWTHGPLLLEATMSGSPGEISLDQLTAFAEQMERVYQASGFGDGAARRAGPVQRLRRR